MYFGSTGLELYEVKLIPNPNIVGSNPPDPNLSAMLIKLLFYHYCNSETSTHKLLSLSKRQVSIKAIESCEPITPKDLKRFIE